MEYEHSQEKCIPENGPVEEKKDGTLEKENAETIALEKLIRVTGKDYRNYVIRFVHSDEYLDIVEKNRIKSQEVYVPSALYHNPDEAPTFIEYLTESKLNWAKTARTQTDWDFSIRGMEEHEELIQFFKKAHQEAQSKQDPKNILVNTLLSFHDILVNPESEFNKRIKKKSELLSGSGSGYYSTVDGIVSVAEHYSETKKKTEELKNQLRTILGNQSEKLIDLIRDSTELKNIWHTIWHQQQSGRLLAWSANEEKNIEKIVQTLISQQSRYNLCGGEDKVAVISEFIENPKNFFSSEKLHQLFQALTWGNKRTGTSQYQIALIFDMSAVKKTSTNNFWESLKGYSKDREKPDYNPKQYLLAAISVIPNRKFTEEIVNCSKNSGEWSHPVFDSRGILRYPK